MRRAKDTGTVIAPLAVGAVAIVCCAGLPAVAGVFAGVTLAATLGVGGGLVALITVVAATVLMLRGATPSLLSACTEAEPVRIEVLYFDGCPNHEALLPRLREILSRTDNATPIDLRRIPDDETARRERFLGSPTVRIDGCDVEPDADRRTDYGLKCPPLSDARRPIGTAGGGVATCGTAHGQRGRRLTVDLDGLLGAGSGAGQSFADRAAALAQPERALYGRILEYFIEAEPLQPASPVGRRSGAADRRRSRPDRHPRSRHVRLPVLRAADATPESLCMTGAATTRCAPSTRSESPTCSANVGKSERANPTVAGSFASLSTPRASPPGRLRRRSRWPRSATVCCLAQSACPHINLFAAPDAATRYLDDHALQGSILSIADATAAGKRLFGDLLNQPTNTPAG